MMLRIALMMNWMLIQSSKINGVVNVAVGDEQRLVVQAPDCQGETATSTKNEGFFLNNNTGNIFDGRDNLLAEMMTIDNDE